MGKFDIKSKSPTRMITFQEVSGRPQFKIDQDTELNDDRLDIKESSTDDQKVLNRIREESGKE